MSQGIEPATTAPGHDGRIRALERSIDRLNIIVGVAVALFTIFGAGIGKGVLDANAELARQGERIAAIGLRLDRLDAVLGQRLDRIEDRLEALSPPLVKSKP